MKRVKEITIKMSVTTNIIIIIITFFLIQVEGIHRFLAISWISCIWMIANWHYVYTSSTVTGKNRLFLKTDVWIRISASKYPFSSVDPQANTNRGNRGSQAHKLSPHQTEQKIPCYQIKKLVGSMLVGKGTKQLVIYVFLQQKK